MKTPKRIVPHWIPTAKRLPPAFMGVCARDSAWIEHGKARQGRNERVEWNGRHSHWHWGTPTHWRPYLR